MTPITLYCVKLVGCDGAGRSDPLVKDVAASTREVRRLISKLVRMHRPVVDYIGIFECMDSDLCISRALPAGAGFDSLFPVPAEWIGGAACRGLLGRADVPEADFLATVREVLASEEWRGPYVQVTRGGKELGTYANILRFDMDKGCSWKYV